MARPRIFTTHRHRYSDDFWTLSRAMRARFDYDDLSVHDHKFDGWVPNGVLEQAIVNRINRCNLFIAIGRRAVAHGEWCTWEIEAAIAAEKPIVCYSPYAVDPVLAPAVARYAETYVGYFTQMRVLEGYLDDLGLDH